jgi:hypothetical protein
MIHALLGSMPSVDKSRSASLVVCGAIMFAALGLLCPGLESQDSMSDVPPEKKFAVLIGIFDYQDIRLP